MDQTYSGWAFLGLLMDERGAQKSSPPYILSRISYDDENWHSHTLPKEDPKIYESRDTPPEFC